MKRSQLKILLVEDDDAARSSLGRVLQRAGHEVAVAVSGEQALTLLNEAGEAFDIILTDLLLGAVDGVEVLRQTRMLPDPPEVILLTGYGTIQTAIDSLRAGAFDYLLKPCKPEDLLHRISSAGERRGRHAGT